MKIATVVLGVLLAVGLGVAPATAYGSRPGVTPTSRCVTPSEFYSLERGQTTRDEAERILDWAGASASKRPGVNTWNVRKYRGCNGYQKPDGSWRSSRILVFYKNGRVQDAGWAIVEWVPDEAN